MFLKLKSAVLAVSLLFTSVGFAQTITTLDTGSFVLVKGEKELCRNFAIKEADLFSKKFEFGGFYRFEVANSDYNVESDLDPNCTFREQNRKVIVSSSETTLIRVNEEICKGQVSNRTTSKASLRQDEIQISHELNGIDPYICIWKRK